MSLRRLGYYIFGGRPPNGALTHPGCREKRLPERSVPLLLEGRLYFALEAVSWTGGAAFYDPYDSDETPVRAYLITTAQFSDIAAQEMEKEPGTDLDLGEVLSSGRSAIGPGCYETLFHLGELDGLPLLTFSAPWRSHEVEYQKPSSTYMALLATGLRESHGWDGVRIGSYLSGRQGAAGHWSAGDVAELLAEDSLSPVLPEAWAAPDAALQVDGSFSV